MAKKKKHPEHENLERWLVSYADFMTLLFATFVVLYALNQIDVASFDELQKSLRQSFSFGMLEGASGMMDTTGENFVGDFDASSMIMMEYLSPKYEEEAYQEIKKELEEMAKKDKDLENISVEIDERGLVIKFTDADMMFKSGSAMLQPKAEKYLHTVGKIIHEKFKVHLIRVEGHTDSDPIKSAIFPSNWELSSARASSIVRFMIERLDFQPVLFSAVGLAEHRPINKNITLADKAANRRVEIIVLRNKFKKIEMGASDALNQKILEIEHIKVKNKPKQQIDTDTDFIKFEEINFMPQGKIIEVSDTYKEESNRIESIRKRNQKMFNVGN